MAWSTLTRAARIASVYPAELIEQEHFGARERHLACSNGRRNAVVDRYGRQPGGQADPQGGARLQPLDEEIRHERRPGVPRSAAQELHDSGSSAGPFQRSTGLRTAGLNGNVTF